MRYVPILKSWSVTGFWREEAFLSPVAECFKIDQHIWPQLDPLPSPRPIICLSNRLYIVYYSVCIHNSTLVITKIFFSLVLSSIMVSEN